MTPPAAIGPWPQGMWNTTTEARVPADALADARNVDIDRTGAVTRRGAWAPIDDQPAHSLFEFDGRILGVVGGALGYLDPGAFTVIGGASGPLHWTVLNGEAVFCSSDGVWAVRDGAVAQLDGELLPTEEQLVLAPLPGGNWIEYWSGRLVLARGNTLIFSEPLRYGVYDQLRGFVQFEERVFWVAPMPTGLYVGLRNSVRWLAGTDPAALEQRRVGGPSWRGAAAVLKADHLDPKLQVEEAAVWMTPSGFALGLPSGNVVLPQAGRLQGIPLGSGRLVVQGDRVTVMANN